ncbi:MAG TPA: M48 family metallopeptidase, partial [Chloroflexia bacterium]
MQDAQVALATTLAEATTFQVSSHAVAKRARFVFAAAIGFYVYALVLCAVFIGVGWGVIVLAQFASGGANGIFICAVLPVVVLCWGSALLIVWSLIPRYRRFKAPGQRLDLAGRPALYEVVADVANRTGQRMPSEVYMHMEVNASVTERGGIFGANKRRVLTLGLPLFSLLTVSQFKSLLTHEFGHFYWGDTRLGPWLHRSHEAIRNTIQLLHDIPYTAWINLLLFGYAEWFVDITQDLVRKQEFLADQLAAKTTGREVTIEALQRMHVGEDAFDAYWRGTITPMLWAGVRLPLLEGFRR